MFGKTVERRTLHSVRTLSAETGLHPKRLRRLLRASGALLFALAKQQGRHFRKVKQELDAAGIRPALDPEKVGATFYRRADLQQPSF